MIMESSRIGFNGSRPWFLCIFVIAFVTLLPFWYHFLAKPFHNEWNFISSYKVTKGQYL